jgi:DNA-binding GntR family transcriptional regulator
LLATIKTLHVNIDRYVRVMMAKLGYQERSQQEHRQLLQACQRGDVEAAVTLLAEHIEAAGVQLVAYLQENQKSRG